MPDETPTDTRVFQVVNTLVRAIQDGDFATANACLAEHCDYDSNTGLYEGCEAAVRAFQTYYQLSQQLFDEIRTDLFVEPRDDRHATVHFSSYLLKAGAGWHRYRCRQDFAIDERGLVVQIVDFEIPEESQALERWMGESGIEL
jgi:hypothetical protein